MRARWITIFWGLSLVLGVVLGWPRPADAQTAATPPDDAAVLQIARGLNDNKTAEDAVTELVALKDPRVVRLFDRLMENQLRTLGADGPIVWRPDGEDGAFDPLAKGHVAVEPVPTAEQLTDLKSFRGKRKARRAVQQRLSLLGLEVDDAETRAEAAREVGNKRQAEALPLLQQLAENDPDATVRRFAAGSAALIVLDDAAAPVADRVAAARTLGEVKSIRARGPLEALANDAGADAQIAAAARSAVGQIDRHVTFTNWVSNAFFGLSAGSILVLLALGLAITFGLMGVINMAHGEMLMVGAVTTWACFNFFGGALGDWFYLLAFPLAFLVAAAVGWLTEVLIVRHLYARPLDSLLATIGVSFVLIQAVRNWKGDNLGLKTPEMFGGGFLLMQDVTLAYNRLFIIGLCVFCVLATVFIFRFTKIGLMLRATVQNRAMAESLGVNTRRVDMFTFALGAGLAGLGGYGLVLVTNISPQMGQTYIVNSFLTVVVGGVGKLVGVIVSGLGVGFLTKFIEPLWFFDSTYAQIAVILIVVLFIQRRPGGLFPDKGRAANAASGEDMPFLTRHKWSTDWICGSLFVGVFLVLVPLLYGTGSLSPEFVNKLGYILAFAICAIGLDLIWGYMGVLSLCQFLFFGLGGYCMGLYLINHGPMQGPNGDIPTALFVVMSGVGDLSPPWFLPFFASFPVAVLLGLLIPGLLALLIGVTNFRSRVRGVYFAILTQAITVAFYLLFQKNELVLGGTNGLTNFTHVLGFAIVPGGEAGPFAQTRFWMYIVTVGVLIAVFVLAKLIVHSGFGRLLVAIRDDETRLRFIGYRTWIYKAAAFTIAGVFAGIGGMLYVPQKGIITPGSELSALASIMVVVWVAFGGRGTLWGAVWGTIAVRLLYDALTSGAPDWYVNSVGALPGVGGFFTGVWSADSWMFVLGGLFILVPLLLPGGLMSLPSRLRRAG